MTEHLVVSLGKTVKHKINAETVKYYAYPIRLSIISAAKLRYSIKNFG